MEAEVILTADQALKQDPLPVQCLCPECGSTMTLTEDSEGMLYVCDALAGEYDCGDIVVEPPTLGDAYAEQQTMIAETEEAITSLKIKLNVKAGLRVKQMTTLNDLRRDIRSNSEDWKETKLYHIKISGAPFMGQWMTDDEMAAYRKEFELLGSIVEIYDAHTGGLSSDHMPY